MTLPLQDLLQLGFAVAAGVLIDTFITRTLIVPSLVALIGRWNWWPSRMASWPLGDVDTADEMLTRSPGLLARWAGLLSSEESVVNVL